MSVRNSLVLALLLTGAITSAFAQDDDLSKDHTTLTSNGNSVVLDIYGGRPVSDAVNALELRYGYVITYEDPQYVNSDDITDATVYFRKDHRPSGPGVPKLLVPRGSHLSMQIPTASCVSPTDLMHVLQQLADLRGSRGGHFHVEQDQSSSTFHVVPTEARDRDGNWSAQGSPLDARISFPAVTRDESQLLATIVGAVSFAAHVSMGYAINGGIVVRPASMHGFPSPGFQYNIGADAETAREVLESVLRAQPDRRQTWALMHGVEAGPASYTLNMIDLPNNQCQSAPPPAPLTTTSWGGDCLSCAHSAGAAPPPPNWPAPPN